MYISRIGRKNHSQYHQQSSTMDSFNACNLTSQCLHITNHFKISIVSKECNIIWARRTSSIIQLCNIVMAVIEFNSKLAWTPCKWVLGLSVLIVHVAFYLLVLLLWIFDMSVDKTNYILTMASIVPAALSIILLVPDKAAQALSPRQYQSSVHIQLLLKGNRVRID